MSKKYENRVKELDERKRERDHDQLKEKQSPVVDGSSISRQSVGKQKKALKDIKKKMDKSRKIW